MATTSTRIDFISPATVRANADAVIRFAGLSAAPGGALKPVLVDALNRLQALPTPASDGEEPTIMFVDGQAGEMRRLIDEFGDPDDNAQVPQPIPPAQRDAVRKALKDGLQMVESFNPEHARLVRDLVAVVIVGGGVKSVSASLFHQIGTVFVNPQPGWSTLDYAETLLHESIHEAQYLDQMNVEWYVKPFQELAQSDVLVQSPIRRRPRPLPWVLQAATVGVPLVDLRWWAGARAEAIDLCQRVAESLVGVREREDLLSARGRQVLEELADQLAGSAALAAAEAEIS